MWTYAVIMSGNSARNICILQYRKDLCKNYLISSEKMPVLNNQFKPALSHSNRVIASLMVQVGRQKELLDIVRSALPEALAKEVKCCFIKNRKLLLYTESAAWASQLRFYSQVLEESTRSKCGETIEATKVKITKVIKAPNIETLKPKIPSSENIGLIKENIENAADSPLKSSLLRLSKTLEKRYDAAAPD